jgi:hypothetical protein
MATLNRVSFGTMLLISAIDVLLCAFTAGLTLFFFGSNYYGFAQNAEKGTGWSGAMIVLMNRGPNQLYVSSGCHSEAQCALGSSCICRSPDAPSNDHAWLLNSRSREGAVDTIVTIVGPSGMSAARVRCRSGATEGNKIRIGTEIHPIVGVEGCDVAIGAPQDEATVSQPIRGRRSTSGFTPRVLIGPDR